MTSTERINNKYYLPDRESSRIETFSFRPDRVMGLAKKSLTALSNAQKCNTKLSKRDFIPKKIRREKIILYYYNGDAAFT